MSSAESGDAQVALLEKLMASVSDAIQAMVEWDVEAFHAAVARQMALCAELNQLSHPPSTGATEAAHRVQQLNRVYQRMVTHSIQWTRTLQSMLPVDSGPESGRNCYRG
ncbi:MAG: hypothetical protein P4M01_12835 [Acidobacteriota bacterium]|nr:hypothetical protein [Acidobacteriota bacterium]